VEQEISILIIDDDEALCQTLSDILGELGYYVESATSGKEAIKKGVRRYFNVALIDIRLPDIDGIELLGILKEINPELECLMITAYASLETAVEALRCGASDYVIKPLKMKEVLDGVEAALKRQQQVATGRQRLLLNKEFYRSLSIVDELTGLYNYRHFQELLSRELTQAKRYSHPLSLSLIDIDELKGYQDSWGHIAGDEALREIARIVLSSVRGADVVVRYGGEEFAIILPETSKQGAVVAAERVRQRVAEATLPTGDRLTISIGVAAYPEDAEDREQLLSHADQALYRAKEMGRNQTCVWSGDEA
jgi:diguanylate cyclase (GGDEF)-like protein